MKAISVLASFLALVAAGTLNSYGAGNDVVTILPEDLVYQRVPGVPGVSAALALGSPKEGPYTTRARFDAGAKLVAHTHPDTRTVTVIQGNYYFAVGESFDEAALRGYGPGTLFVVPAGTPHFAAARDGEVYVQESGIGPTGFTPTGR